MLRGRVLTSVVLLLGLVGVFYLDHRDGARARLLLALVLVTALGAVRELRTLLANRSHAPGYAFPAICVVLVVAAGWTDKLFGFPSLQAPLASLGPVMLAYGLSVLLLLSKAVLGYRNAGGNLEVLSAEIFIVSYVGVLLSLTAQLRWVAGTEAGYLAIGSLIVTAKCGDIGAYTCGRLLGRRKMAPQLSPGKTWAGGVGAIVAAGAASLAWFQWATPVFEEHWVPSPWYWTVAYGMLIGLAGLIGDLCESLVKRDIGVKDSAQVLPGFGGLLDLLDSLLYAGPVAFVLWQVMPLATWLE